MSQSPQVLVLPFSLENTDISIQYQSIMLTDIGCSSSSPRFFSVVLVFAFVCFARNSHPIQQQQEESTDDGLRFVNILGDTKEGCVIMYVNQVLMAS